MMFAKLQVAAVLSFFLGAAVAFGADVAPLKAATRSPDAAPVLINGHFGPDEWIEAGALKIEDRVLLCVNQDRHFVYVGIRFLKDMHTGIDLYVAAPGQTPKKLHVSSALGDAEFAGGTWGEIQWGKNLLWTANSIMLISDNGEQRVVSLEGFEFQISKSLFSGPGWRLYLHLKRPDLKFPKDASPDSVDAWLEIGLER